MDTLSLPARAFADKMLNWYDSHRRILPWREDPTPYHVWLSEIMLQQTQVQTVIPYYERFITALPTIADLAAIDQNRLHKLWEGLGYYSRADHLHEAAQVLVSNYGGLLPETYSALLTLPGIGPYTAGAIASIAFGERVCAVDGNVLRILSRVTAYDGAINVASSAKPLKELAASLVPAHRPGDFNQSLMDLGASICSANGAPHCDRCPLADGCAAYHKKLTWLLPVKKSKKPRSVEKHTIVVITAGSQVWIRRRPQKQLLAGLWEFLDLPGDLTRQNVLDHLQEHGLAAKAIEDLGKARHLFTHKEWQMQGWHVQLAAPLPLADGIWVDVSELHATYAMAGAISAYRNQLFNKML